MMATRRAVRSRRVLYAMVAVATLCVGERRVRAQDAEGVLYRIFLADGSTLVSVGEFARVADRVVFSMPLRPAGSGPSRLQLVSIPASAVDWTTTDHYVASARAGHYAATRGEAEFANVSGQVAWALNEIALTNDPKQRLQLAERARQTLADWSRASLGYRAKEAADLGTLLDEIISGLRAAAGVDRFELSLVADAGPAPPVPLLPPPTLRESIEQVLTAARLTEDPTGRIDLLRSAMSLLDGSEATLPAAWVVGARTRAIRELSAELRLEGAYAVLTASTLGAAASSARRANVGGVEGLIKKALDTDDVLGRKRPEVMSALLAALDAKLDAARRLRLARDTWELRVPAYRAYQKALAGPLARLDRARGPLDDIRRLAGPSPVVLARADRQLDQVARALARVKPPDDLRPVHAMLTSALQLARSACRVRREAIEAGDLATAWDASSAAAGALILVGRVKGDLDRFLKPPQLP